MCELKKKQQRKKQKAVTNAYLVKRNKRGSNKIQKRLQKRKVESTAEKTIVNGIKKAKKKISSVN